MANDTTVHVTAMLRARPDTRTQLQRELEAVKGPTRKEPGCLRYELYQQADQAEKFLFIEQWQTADDLNRHLQQPYIQSLIQKLDSLLAEPMQITQWQSTE